MAEQKTLEELLNASTFQGMTDEEIQRIIDYRCTCAADAAAAQARNEVTAENVATVSDALNRSRAHSKALFDAAVAMTPIFRTVQDG